MSDFSRGDGWWQASDDRWYPPETHPDYVAPPEVEYDPVKSEADPVEAHEEEEQDPGAFFAPETPTGTPERTSLFGDDPDQDERDQDDPDRIDEDGPGVAASSVASEPNQAPDAEAASSFTAPSQEPKRSKGEAPTPREVASPKKTKDKRRSRNKPAAKATSGAVAPAGGPSTSAATNVPKGDGKRPVNYNSRANRKRRPAVLAAASLAVLGLIAGGIYLATRDGDDAQVSADATVPPVATLEDTGTATLTSVVEPTAPAATAPVLAGSTGIPEPTSPDAPTADPGDEPAAGDPIVVFVDGGFVVTEQGTDWFVTLRNNSENLGAADLMLTADAFDVERATVDTSSAFATYVPPGGEITLAGTFFDPSAPVVDFDANWEWLENDADPARAVTWSVGKPVVVEDGANADLTVDVSHDNPDAQNLVRVTALLKNKGVLVGIEFTFVDVPPAETVTATILLFDDVTYDEIDIRVTG